MILRSTPVHVVIVMLLLCFPGSASAGHWTDSWASIEVAVAGIETIQADFVQTKELSFLVASLRSEGRFYFRQPDALRWEYLRPVRSVLTMQGQTVRRHQWSEGKWQPDQGAQLAGMQVVMKEIGRWLQGDFRSNPDFHATLGPGPEITLEPANEVLQRMLSKIRLSLSDQPGVINTVTIEEGDAGRTTIGFDKVTLNAALNARLFSDPESPQ